MRAHGRGSTVVVPHQQRIHDHRSNTSRVTAVGRCTHSRGAAAAGDTLKRIYIINKHDCACALAVTIQFCGHGCSGAEMCTGGERRLGWGKGDAAFAASHRPRHADRGVSRYGTLFLSTGDATATSVPSPPPVVIVDCQLYVLASSTTFIIHFTS